MQPATLNLKRRRRGAVADARVFSRSDFEQLLPKLKAAGVRVLSKDAALVHWSDTVRNVFVKDPNGLNLELVGNVGQ